MRTMILLRDNTHKAIIRPMVGAEGLHLILIVRKAPRSLSRCPWTVICSLRDDEYSNRQGLPEAKRADPDIKKSKEVGRRGVRGRQGNNCCCLLISAEASGTCFVTCEWLSRERDK